MCLPICIFLVPYQLTPALHVVLPWLSDLIQIHPLLPLLLQLLFCLLGHSCRILSLSSLAVLSGLWSSQTQCPYASRVQPFKEQSCVDWLCSSEMLPHLLHFVMIMFFCFLSKGYKCHCFTESVIQPEVLLFQSLCLRVISSSQFSTKTYSFCLLEFLCSSKTDTNCMLKKGNIKVASWSSFPYRLSWTLTLSLAHSLVQRLPWKCSVSPCLLWLLPSWLCNQ